MSNRNIVYRKIYARMALLGLGKSEVARLLGINYSTLQHKLRGETSFTLDEAIHLKRILCMKDALEDAFERCESVHPMKEEMHAAYDRQ